MTLQYKVYFTAIDGSQAEVIGDPKAIDAVERAFARAGIRFNREIETWDEGYYHEVAQT